MEDDVLFTDGTIKVTTVIGAHLGTIVGCVLRHNKVYCYEVGMFTNNEYKIERLYPKEFKIVGDGKYQTVGYKQNE